MLRRVHRGTVNPSPLGKHCRFDSYLVHQINNKCIERYFFLCIYAFLKYNKEKQMPYWIDGFYDNSWLPKKPRLKNQTTNETRGYKIQLLFTRITLPVLMMTLLILLTGRETIAARQVVIKTPCSEQATITEKKEIEKRIVPATRTARYANDISDFSDSAQLMTVAQGLTATYTAG